MLRNYLLTTWRNISRRKAFTLLNISGLSIGLAASLLILQYVKDELSYEDFHENAQHIYRVQYDRFRDKDLIFQCATVFNKIGPALKADYPEIEKFCRLYLRYGGGIIRYEDISIKEENIFNADQSFFEMFSFPFGARRSKNSFERAQYCGGRRTNGEKILRVGQSFRQANSIR